MKVLDRYLAIRPDLAERFATGELARPAQGGEGASGPAASAVAVTVAVRVAGRTAGTYDDMPYERRGAVAIVDIEGPLRQRASWYDSHESIRARIEVAASDPMVRVVALRIDSPGGVVAGCFDAVRAARAALASAGKVCLAWGGGDGAWSAGYAWASVASQMYVTDTSGCGSVGVLCALEDWTSFNEQAGIRVVIVRSGARKAEGHPDIPLDDATIAHEQAVIDGMAAVFADVVSQARGMSTADVLSLEGGCFYGSDAVKVRLADGVESFDAFLARCEALAQEMGMKSIARRLGLAENASEADIEREMDRRDTTAREASVKAAADLVAAQGEATTLRTALTDEVTEHAMVTGRAMRAELDALRAEVKDPLALRRILSARPVGAALPADKRESGEPPKRRGEGAPKAAADLAAAYDKLSNTERAALAKNDPDTWESMRAAWRVSKGREAEGSN